MKQLTTIATDHYLKAVVKYHGWRPWRALVTQMQEKVDHAENHYSITLVRYVWDSGAIYSVQTPHLAVESHNLPILNQTLLPNHFK